MLYIFFSKKDTENKRKKLIYTKRRRNKQSKLRRIFSTVWAGERWECIHCGVWRQSICHLLDIEACTFVNFPGLPIGRGRKGGDDIRDRDDWGDFPVSGENWMVDGWNNRWESPFRMNFMRFREMAKRAAGSAAKASQ